MSVVQVLNGLQRISHSFVRGGVSNTTSKAIVQPVSTQLEHGDVTDSL